MVNILVCAGFKCYSKWAIHGFDMIEILFVCLHFVIFHFVRLKLDQRHKLYGVFFHTSVAIQTEMLIQMMQTVHTQLGPTLSLSPLAVSLSTT